MNPPKTTSNYYNRGRGRFVTEMLRLPMIMVNPLTRVTRLLLRWRLTEAMKSLLQKH